MAEPAANPATGGVTRRIISAAVMIPPVLASIYFGSPFFEALVLAGVIILAWEWGRMCGRSPKWLIAGVFAIAVPALSIVDLRNAEDGQALVFWLMALVWMADTGAYIVGNIVGGPKFAPRISPKKTWSGFVGGVTCAGIAGAVAASALDKDELIILAVISAALGAISQFGDLAESWVKRHFGVKDTGTLIPGHGGLFDRVDGLLAAGLAMWFLNMSSEGGLLSWV